MSKSQKMTPEAQENLLIALAYDLAEERIRAGTASAQEITHFLKLGSTKSRAEIDKLQEENKLLRAKTEALKASQQSDEMFKAAIKAMQRYRGDEFDGDDI